MKDIRNKPVTFAEAVMAVLAVAWIVGMPYLLAVLRIFC